MQEEKQYPLEYKGLKIDPVIFTQGFVPGCNVSICGGECCDWGVYMDRDFKKVIMAHEKEIIEVMDEFQIKDSTKWFEKEIVEDTDFPTGFAIGTDVYNNRHKKEMCVFKDRYNYCSLQVAAVKNNMKTRWEIKPRYCVMYPLTIVDKVLTYDDEHSVKLGYCGIHHKRNFTQTIFEGMKEEIKYVIGEEGYEILNKYFQENYKSKKKGE